jgi:hypothetical protein
VKSKPKRKPARPLALAAAVENPTADESRLRAEAIASGHVLHGGLRTATCRRDEIAAVVRRGLIDTCLVEAPLVALREGIAVVSETGIARTGESRIATCPGVRGSGAVVGESAGGRGTETVMI